MNEMMTVFENEQFGQVRTVERNGEPWFVAADVCKILNHTNVSVALQMLDEDERGKQSLGQVSGNGVIQTREMNVVNEAGLYQLIIRSNKPEAKAFKRWITHEVIPSIRKHGMYATPDTVERLLNDPDTAIKLLQEIKAERAARLALEAKAEEDAPKVLFAESVASSQSDLLVGEVAKILRQNGVEIGQNRLFELLRRDGFLISRRGTDWNMPTQKSVEMGLMRIKETCVTHSDGHISVSKTPKITGKGSIYFVNRYSGTGQLAYAE